MVLDTKLDFQEHLKNILSKISKTIGLSLESVQYNAALATAGPIRGTSKEKLYNELGLETPEKRRWCRKLCCFFEIFRY